MDKTIRRNEICVVGLPRCDFVFSSTRTCFIAYGFEESPLEMNVLRGILETRGIQAIEAGGSLAPGQNAFCAKICSKIITAQFCIVLLNNETRDGQEVPNANVNMEYGLMIGFNKYVIPFQRASQSLPFNVAGLDTIKYTNSNFEQKATSAIEYAISETERNPPSSPSPDQLFDAFILMKRALVTPVNTEGDRSIFQMGSPLGFNLLNDFGAVNYMFFGNFTMLRPEVVIWRVNTLIEILEERRQSMSMRVAAGMVTDAQAVVFDELLARFQIWIVVTSADDKSAVENGFRSGSYRMEVFSIDDVMSELNRLGHASA